MSKIGVNISIDVTKIDKSHLVQGKKGTYLNLTAFIDPNEADQYGNNGMVTQGLNKEARDAGQKGAILGNTKIFWQDQGQAPVQNPVQQSPQQAFGGAIEALNTDCPF